MTRRRLLALLGLLFLPVLLECRPAATVADIIQGAACGLAYAELGRMPPGCDIPVPMMRQQADDLEKKAHEQEDASYNPDTP